MSKDGYLPDDVSESDFDRAFPPDCPDECASMQTIYSECGGVDLCECYPNTILGLIRGWWYGPCERDNKECDCAERNSDAQAEAAEVRADLEWDR